ncbi:uncharacterized protein OCT59_000351 [Rhizophagus irregularis]|nr:hypothetical protein OCT59_000351 [Rhizophagus irregularis]
MACSKLFSGDLPELINEVIQYFRYNHKTLHSCILVNRLWCRLAIPLLWEDPFSIKSPKNYHFIEIYLHYLNNDDKAKLNEYVIHNELLPSNTLFNYPRFIQRLDTYKVWFSIEKWVATVGTSTTRVKHIFRSLFLIFIENEVSLHSFKIKITPTCGDIIELILQNPNFICNIIYLQLDFDMMITDNTKRFLIFIHSNCNSISSLDFLFPSMASSVYYHSIVEKSLLQIIKSQEKLRKISFRFIEEYPIYHYLSSLKNPNCLNTLNTIMFHHIDFKNIDILSEVFNQLHVLESIHIINCYSLDSKFIQQIINITKPFKLKSLFLDDKISELILEPLIQKFGCYLENFGVNHNISQKLLQLIIKYCSKINYLGPIRFNHKNNKNVYLLFRLIKNITQNLNYLTIEASNISYNYINYGSSSIILQNLGQILPFKLKYLNLSLTINTSDLEIFLKNSQSTFIKKLLIKYIKKEENEDIFPYIKEYIMKTNRVKYLAIVENFNEKYEDLFSQKDKVEEFQLYSNIKVMYYSDLVNNTFYSIKR